VGEAKSGGVVSPGFPRDSLVRPGFFLSSPSGVHVMFTLIGQGKSRPRVAPKLTGSVGLARIHYDKRSDPQLLISGKET
jgi:hypothetical protein